MRKRELASWIRSLEEGVTRLSSRLDDLERVDLGNVRGRLEDEMSSILVRARKDAARIPVAELKVGSMARDIHGLAVAVNALGERVASLETLVTKVAAGPDGER